MLQVFQAIETRSGMIEAEVGLSAVEIYGSEVNDLLNGGKPVGQSRVAATHYVLSGENQVGVSLSGALALIEQYRSKSRL